jgi:hypothetical protein
MSLVDVVGFDARATGVMHGHAAKGERGRQRAHERR